MDSYRQAALELNAAVRDALKSVAAGAEPAVAYSAMEQACVRWRPLLKAGKAEPVRAGYSDKYGQVYVERVGNTGFPDPDEPVALFRAQDMFAAHAVSYYHYLLANDSRVSVEQLRSVEKQLGAFRAYERERSDRMRVPGSRHIWGG